jgi:hypothetical protein
VSDLGPRCVWRHWYSVPVRTPSQLATSWTVSKCSLIGVLESLLDEITEDFWKSLAVC